MAFFLIFGLYYFVRWGVFQIFNDFAVYKPIKLYPGTSCNEYISEAQDLLDVLELRTGSASE